MLKVGFRKFDFYRYILGVNILHPIKNDKCLGNIAAFFVKLIYELVFGKGVCNEAMFFVQFSERQRQ